MSKWRKRLRESGGPTPGQVGGHKRRTLVGECAQWLRVRLGEGPFTPRGLTAELAARGIRTDRRAVWVFLHAEGPGFKKTVLPAEPSRSDIAAGRTRVEEASGQG